MNERFVFSPNPTVQNVLNAFATERGVDVVGQVAGEFVSLVDALHHTQSVGNSTVIHLPDGDNIKFVNVPKQELAHAAFLIAKAEGFNIG